MFELTQKDGNGLISAHFDPLQFLNPSAIACSAICWLHLIVPPIWSVLRHPDRRIGSLSRLGRFWWTPPSRRRGSGTSTTQSSLPGSQILCISWQQPWHEHRWKGCKGYSRFLWENHICSYPKLYEFEVTLSMWSLGSRLQSAKVSSDPSRKLLEDSGKSPEVSPSISSGSGVLRKSSRRRRDFSKAFSRAAKEGKNGKKKNKIKIKNKKIEYTQIQIQFFFHCWQLTDQSCWCVLGYSGSSYL